MDQITHPQVEAQVRALVQWVQSRDTNVAQAAAAAWAMSMLTDVSRQIGTVRVSAIRLMWDQGWSLADISEALGMSRARVHQIINK